MEKKPSRSRMWDIQQDKVSSTNKCEGKKKRGWGNGSILKDIKQMTDLIWTLMETQQL